MVQYWELTQGHGKTQINTIKLCKVLLAVAKLNAPCIHTTSFWTCVCVSNSLTLLHMGRSVKVSLLLLKAFFLKVEKKSTSDLIVWPLLR